MHDVRGGEYNLLRGLPEKLLRPLFGPLFEKGLRHSLSTLHTPLYLQVSVNDPVGLKIIIILSKGIDELFCHLEVGRGVTL